MHFASTTRLASVVILLSGTSAFAQRSWMVELGSNPAAAPTSGPVTVFADPGQRLDVAVYVQDPAGTVITSLNGYQIIMPWFASGGDSGTVQYSNKNPGMGGGDTVHVDTNNPDWVFTNEIVTLQSVYNETPTTIFGAIYNTLPGFGVNLGPAGTAANPGGPNYVVQFSYQISPNACGVFVLNFNAPPSAPPLSAYFTPAGAGYTVTFQPLHIVIGPQNDDCSNFQALSGGLVTQAVNLDCATLDGPSDCDPGSLVPADVWFRYTAALSTDLTFQLSNIVPPGSASLAVYTAGTCTPAGGGSCAPGSGTLEIPALAGSTYLIQVIGEAGTTAVLNINGCGCVSNADCSDGNFCTVDTCSNCQCTNTPQPGLPCSDFNVCTLQDTCNAAGVCTPGAANSCNDFNPCTADTCVPATGCSNTNVNGLACADDADCNAPNAPSVSVAVCTDSACSCEASPNANRFNSLCLDVRGCDNGPGTIQGLCFGEDAECGGPSPDGALQCSDDDQHPLNGGVCVDQCCHRPGSIVTVDLEIGPTPGGACGGQYFLQHDPACFELLGIATDPDNELNWDFVLLQHTDAKTGHIDLITSLPPGLPCDGGAASHLGGTIARLTFTAVGPCKCGGVDFRPHNPPTKVSGPDGDVPLVGCNLDSYPSGTDEIQIQGDAVITCPEDSTGHADCGSIFRTVQYGPVTVIDDCELIEADISDLCTIEFRKACQQDLDCGRGDICGPFTDCGPDSTCALDPLVDGSGIMCQGAECIGYCTLDTCIEGLCEDHRTPVGLDLETFLDCSAGCAMPPGEVRLACAYTNGCGRTTECFSMQFNSGLNKLVVDLELSPSVIPGDPNDPITRCIEFEIAACDVAMFFVCMPPAKNVGELCSPLNESACGWQPELCQNPILGGFIVTQQVIFGLPENLPGHGSACMFVPPGNWDCVAARDPKHSLSSTCDVVCTEDNVLYTQFKGAPQEGEDCHWLVMGNLDANPLIDVVDYTILAGEYLSTYEDNDTDCTVAPPKSNDFNADFNGDGIVTLADWTFVVFNLLDASKNPCSVVCDPEGAAALGQRPAKPHLSLTRAQLEARGLGDYVDAADANGDGVVDLSDMNMFLGQLTDDGTADVTIDELRLALQRVQSLQARRTLKTRSHHRGD